MTRSHRTIVFTLFAVLAACAGPDVQPSPGPGQAAAPGATPGPAPEVAMATPLIEREIFFEDPEITGGQLSPDGKFISFRRPYKGVMNVWVKRREQPFDAARPITADSKRPVRMVFWSEDSKRVLFMQDEGGNENFHLFAVDPAAPADAGTGVPPASDLTPYPGAKAELVHLPESAPGTALVALNDRDPKLHDLYRVDLRTGKRTLVFKNDQNLVGFETDLTGKLRVTARQTADGGTEILRVDGRKLTQVYACNQLETCYVQRFHKDGKRAYLVTNKGDTDLVRLVLFDPASKTEEPVESDPENQVDLMNAVFSDATEELVGTVYMGDRLRVYPREDALPQGLRAAEADPARRGHPQHRRHRGRRPAAGHPGIGRRPGRHVPVRAAHGQGRPGVPPATQAAGPAPGEDDPGAHHRPRRREGPGVPDAAQGLQRPQPAHRAAATRRALGPRRMGIQRHGPVPGQPGLRRSAAELPGVGRLRQEVPEPGQRAVGHGDHAARPDRRRPLAGQPGRRRSQSESPSWADRTAASPPWPASTFTPDVYAAGVDIVGPSSIPTLLASIPPYWAPMKKLFAVRVGDIDNPTDLARLKTQSPLYSAHQIRAPLLVIQGANDPRVKQAESDQIVVALRDAGRPVEYLVAPDEGHGFAGQENRLAMFAAIERFLGQHLGGRHQSSMGPAVATRLTGMTVDVTKVAARSPGPDEGAVPGPVKGGPTPKPPVSPSSLPRTRLTPGRNDTRHSAPRGRGPGGGLWATASPLPSAAISTPASRAARMAWPMLMPTKLGTVTRPSAAGASASSAAGSVRRPPSPPAAASSPPSSSPRAGVVSQVLGAAPQRLVAARPLDQVRPPPARPRLGRRRAGRCLGRRRRPRPAWPWPPPAAWGRAAPPGSAAPPGRSRRNAGAATMPPRCSGSGSSRITAITSRGSFAGMMPMNDEVQGPHLPLTHFWAVPVLPATWKPSTTARGAVPSGPVTPVMISSIVRAVAADTTRIGSRALAGRARHLFPAVGVDHLQHQPRRLVHAAVGQRRVARHHLQRRHHHPVAEGDVGEVDVAPLLRGRTARRPARPPAPRRCAARARSAAAPRAAAACPAGGRSSPCRCCSTAAAPGRR